VLLDKAAAAHLSASAHKALASSAAADKALVAESNSFYLNLQDSLWLHEGEFFINLNNELFFGDLIDSNGYDATKLSPDMYLLENNWRPWGRQYLHANYSPEIVVSFVKDTLNDSKMCWGKRAHTPLCSHCFHPSCFCFIVGMCPRATPSLKKNSLSSMITHSVRVGG
jgi:hypothetical protein